MSKSPWIGFVIREQSRWTKFIRIVGLGYGVRVLILFSVIAGGCASPKNPTQIPQEPRNIILVIADDVGAEQVPSYASELRFSRRFHPVNLEAVAELEAAGVRFREAWSNPTCSPTRAGIHTGQYPWVHGVTHPLDEKDPNPLDGTKCSSLPSMMPSRYKTALFGKWHLGYSSPALPRNHDWDHYAGSLGGHLPSYNKWDKTIDDDPPIIEYSTHATIDVVDDALAWITDCVNKDSLFLAVLAFNAPHGTLDKKGDWVWLSTDLSPDCYDTSRPLPDERSVYKAQLRCLDHELGRLLRGLQKDSPRALDQTMIIFIGDNGTPDEVVEEPISISPSTPNHAKASLYQGGVHVPFIIADGRNLVAEEYRSKFPMIGHIASPGRTTDALVHTRDLYSTILALAGTGSGGVPSRSLVPFLTSASATEPDYVVTADDNGCAIRDKTYKLIKLNSGREEFYDLILTPWEKTPLTISSLKSAQSDALNNLNAHLLSIGATCK